jgi:hypothetical protein
MADRAQQERDEAGRDIMPASVRLALVAGVGLVLIGALYLISVRGHALLLDLSALSGRAFCF